MGHEESKFGWQNFYVPLNTRDRFTCSDLVDLQFLLLHSLEVRLKYRFVSTYLLLLDPGLPGDQVCISSTLSDCACN